ncbi:MAG: DNA recombination protein RmuC [Bacteroidales bacterium]|nr:DNA recombination protein RmuC [Bacteroidales bacterium]
MTSIIIAAAVAAVIGVAVGWLVGNRGKVRQQTENELLGKQLDQQRVEAEQALVQERTEGAARRQEALDMQRRHYEQLLDEQERRHSSDTAALEERFNNTIKMVKEQMENATSEMLKRRQEEFATASNANLTGIVNPLKETMEKMKEEMAKNSTVQTTMSAEIKTNMEHMIRQSIEAQRSAEELTRAFKHESKTQGDWGEVILSNLLSQQGFTEGKDFETQAVMRDMDGNTIQPTEGDNLRPDVLLHLDEQRDVIIDSKVSMTAYINYANAQEEPLRRQYLREHIASLKSHVDELSAKNYPQYQVNPHLDFVIMFVPHPPALWEATQEEPSLWQDAMQKKVFIADEHTLYAALRIIRITWTHIDQEKNHQRLYDLAQEMIERTGNFLKDYNSVGKNLQDALEAYESGKKRLMPDGRSITTTANQILALGLDNTKTSKKRKSQVTIIPTEYLEPTAQASQPEESQNVPSAE